MIFVMTGAGISKESGLNTFRDADGLWRKVRLEDVATPGAFARNPKRVQDFYNARRRELTGGHIQPQRRRWPGSCARPALAGPGQWS